MSDSSPEVKAAFRTLATALDDMKSAEAELFLAKLAILLAEKLGDHVAFQDAVTRAMR